VLTELGFPVLVGASRKRFLGLLLAGRDGRDGTVGALRRCDGRDTATAAVSALAAAAGAWGVRVHDAAGSRDAVAVATAWRVGAATPVPPAGGPR
jgi:dihydropteroate synthase